MKGRMEYDAFISEITGMISEHLEGTEKIQMHDVLKNNGRRMTGISVPQEEKGIAKVVYLEPFYTEYLEGGEIRELAGKILTLCRESRDTEKDYFEIFSDHRRLRRRLSTHLINFARNEKMLEDAPHKRFLDLAVVCHCSMEVDGLDGYFLVKYEHLGMMGIDEGTLWKYAESVKKDHVPVIAGMSEVLKDMMEMSMGYGDAALPIFPEEQEMMYVLSNENRFYGAGCITDPFFLERVAEVIGGDYFVLPSSIHECLAVAADSGDAQDLRCMVRDVNRSVVSGTDFLSDSVYLYERNKRKLKITE